MFHWICPECGREIPPAVKECPDCDPKAASVAAIPEPVAPPPLPVVAPPPAPVLSTEAALPIDPLLALAESIRAAQVPVEPAPAHPAPESPASEPVQPEEPAEEVAVLVAAEPVAEAAAAAAEEIPPVAEVREPEPHPEAPLEAAPVAPPPEVPAPIAAPIAAPLSTISAEPADEKPREPLLLAEAPRVLALLAPAPPEPISQDDIMTEEIDLREFAGTIPEIARALAAEPQAPQPPAPQPAEAVSVTSIKPQPTAPPEHRPGPPLALDLAASTAELPLAERPPSGSWLQLAGLQDYKEPARRAMQPAVPEVKILAPDSGPRVTLPGPTLPPELTSLEQAHLTVLPNHTLRAPSALPGWAVSLLFVIGIPALGAALLFYFVPLGRSSAEARPAPQEPRTAVVEASSHPLAQYIEVTGFRFIVDLNKKSEIHYLVVNHSATELTDMTVYVTLRAADAKAGQPPVCRFSFRAPALAPFESQEMTSPIERVTHPVALPEWQDLRPEVQIAP